MEEKELTITAELANLSLSTQERAAFENEVNRILEYFDVMGGIDLEGVEATTHAGVQNNRTRPDVPRDEDLSLPILKNAPGRRERFFAIPKVL